MRYAQIREMDISNGEGIGVSLFVQGCDFHCPGCFNQETWEFPDGKPWEYETEISFLKLVDRPYIKRVSFLGGEPLAAQNVIGVHNLVGKITKDYPDKMIWLYTGFTWESIFYPVVADNFDIERDLIIQMRQDVVKHVDVLVDGRYDETKRDLTLAFRGSSNQRLIDVNESLNQGKLVLWRK